MTSLFSLAGGAASQMKLVSSNVIATVYNNWKDVTMPIPALSTNQLAVIIAEVYMPSTIQCSLTFHVAATGMKSEQVYVSTQVSGTNFSGVTNDPKRIVYTTPVGSQTATCSALLSTSGGATLAPFINYSLYIYNPPF